MDNNKKSGTETKIFSRVLIVGLCLFIVGLIIASFGWGSSPLTITAEIVTLLLLLVVLALSETFDNFSLANLFEVKREKAETEKKLEAVKEENKELTEQLTNLFSATLTTFNQNTNANSTTNSFHVDFHNPAQKTVIEPAKQEIITEKEQEAEEVAQNTTAQNNSPNYVQRRKMQTKIDGYLLDTYCQKRQIPKLSVYRDMTFSDAFTGIDPIMDRKIIFDAYYKAPQEELFFELKSGPYSTFWMYNLYYQISKVLFYQNAKKQKAKLVLLMPVLPEKYQRRYGGARGIEQLKAYFAPAILNGLLEVEALPVSAEWLSKAEAALEQDDSN